MIYSVSQYMLSVEHIDMMARTLTSRSIVPLRNDDGTLKCRVGNSAIVFEVMCDGIHSALRAYMRQHHNLKSIYGENYYPDELLVNVTDTKSGLVDVVLHRWYDGETLQDKIEDLCDNSTKMASIALLFEEFAISLLNENWAHGDLKPENIIIGREGMHLIDFDAMYRPGFAAEDCIETGTRQYQHPKRDKSLFCKSIDDYPIALIVTALAAISKDSRLGRKVANSDYLLIRPALAIEGKDEELEQIEKLFAEVGDARHYRIAQMLRSSHPTLPRLREFLGMKVCEEQSVTEEPISEYHNGYWGYTLGGKFVIPPYYDIAFDFSEGLGLVRIADVWHFVDKGGRVVITCGRGSGIKPFCNGVTRIKREDGEIVIYRDGRTERR